MITLSLTFLLFLCKAGGGRKASKKPGYILGLYIVDCLSSCFGMSGQHGAAISTSTHQQLPLLQTEPIHIWEILQSSRRPLFLNNWSSSHSSKSPVDITSPFSSTNSINCEGQLFRLYLDHVDSWN